MPPGFEHKLEVASERSSSSISSPPTSPQRINNSDTIRVAQPQNANPGISGDGVAGLTSHTATGNPAQPAVASNTTAQSTNGNTSTTAASNANASAPEKPKRQRKKKEVGPDGKPVPNDKPKEKKPRKPREPKDKTAGATGEKTTAPRKKQKTEPKTDVNLEDKPAHDASTQRQQTLTSMVGSTFQPPTQPASTMTQSEGLIRSSLPPPHTSNPSTPRPYSSGQNYDPIRGSTVESRPQNQTNVPPPAQASPHVNRASASPSIASLIDPPTAIKAAALPTFSPRTTHSQPFVPLQQQSPPQRPASTSFAPLPTQASPPLNAAPPISNTMDGAMDTEPTCEVANRLPEIKAPSKSSSSAPTPPAKATRPTPEPPKGTGSGLLSSSDLFGGPSASEPSERKGVNIDLHIPLNPAGGNTINIAQEIVKKYGRDAINPRAAAHREQLLRIAAEQERLGGASNDEMSVDLMSEMEGDSNVEMGGMDDEQSNTGLDADGKPKRKRRKKVEEYDKEDDFIDDTELAWQEQAAVAKDGFFVYSGPLVPEGQQAQVESSAPSRGSRGRGRGARGGKSATSGTTHASLAEKKTDTSTTSTTTKSTRARGRGTGAPRKPRITKADRERLEAEKLDRERTAQGMGGPTGAPIALAPTPTPAPAQPSPLAQQQQAYAQPQQQAQQQPVGNMA